MLPRVLQKAKNAAGRTVPHCRCAKSRAKTARQGRNLKEPVMIYATANTDHCIPIRNLSTTHKHYTTGTDLCSTAADTCRTYCNLPTAINPLVGLRDDPSPEPTAILARPTHIPIDHTTTVGLPYSLTGHMPICPPTNAEPLDPTPLFGRPIPNPNEIRHQSWLNHYEPLHYILSLITIRICLTNFVAISVNTGGIYF